MENGINHKYRSDESNGFTERFDGAVWTRRFSRKDTMHSNGTKQIGGITGENCYKCQDWQSWKMFDSCVNFSWFFWEVWLGELATLGMIAINDIKDRIQIKRNWWNCWNSWNENNQPKGRSQKNGTSCQTMGRWGSKVPNFLVKIKTRLFLGLCPKIGVAVGGWGSRVSNKYMEFCPKNCSFPQKNKMLQTA